MFDHVEIAVSDLAASERFYRAALSLLGFEPSHADADLVDWDDWGVVPVDAEHGLTTGLHVVFRAPTTEAADAFRREGFARDPDGNRVEAVHGEPGGLVAHVRIRVPDPEASKRFGLTVAPHTGMHLVADEPDLVRFAGDGDTVTFLRDGQPETTRLHLAYTVHDDATVRGFHAAALAAGYADNGGPGERAFYHPGYYGAFVLDPDGNNVEVVNHGAS